jgi:hypothetical protein
MKQAAHELGIQISQDASYLKRLEDAYVDLVEATIGDPLEAREALDKIREGKWREAC